MPARAAAVGCRRESAGVSRSSRYSWPRRIAALVFAAAVVVWPMSTPRAEPLATAESQAFFESLWPAAQARGISRALFERAAAGFVPDPDVIELALLQPEHSKTAGAYV